MNDLAKRSVNEVANAPANYFEAYGEQASPNAVEGSYLKFSKGDYTAGKDDVDVGTKLIANMDKLQVGWVRWHGGKPTKKLLGFITKGFQPAQRDTLGDDNEAVWEVDVTGKSSDPWQFSNELVLKDQSVEGDDGLYTFTTSSRGGINCVGDLCKSYGKSATMRPNEWPVIALNVDSYVHDSYGKIKTPQFDIVGWVAKSAFDGYGDSGDENDNTKGNGTASLGIAGDADRSTTTAKF
jgi:hypothetical protein